MEKTVGSTTTVYVYDEAGHLIGEYTPSGNLIEEHIWLNNRPIGVITSAGLYYVHTDQLGTPRDITNSSKAVVWQWNSDPFGTSVPTGSLTYNLRFPGQYYDAETGRNYNYFRNYDPTIGRYIESDPIGLAGGVNTYTYVGSNPLSWSDPLGLCPEPHHYQITEFTLCSAAEAFMLLEEPDMSGPGAPQAQEGFRGNITLLGNGGKNQITQDVNSSTMTIVNTTMSSHEFYPGSVTLQVTPGPFGIGSIISITGTGTGPNPIENDLVGLAYFGLVASVLAQICDLPM